MSKNDDLMLDVSQAAELKMAFRRHGWTNAEIKRLSEGNILGEVLKVIKGLAEIKYPEHFIDCDANPFVPDGRFVENHKKGGLWKFDLSKISLYLSEEQRTGCIGGHDLLKKIVDKPALNANVLDYLLAHQELIPEEWKGKYVFFWGTIYRRSDGRLFVRYLISDGSRWCWRYDWLDRDFGCDVPAALAS